MSTNHLEIRHDGLDGGRALGWMLFPHDERLRQAHLYREVLEQEIQAKNADGPVCVDALALQAVLAGPGRQELKDIAGDATKRGVVAGDLLLLIYQMHTFEHQEPSFGKALKEYKNFALGKHYGDGEPLKYSEATLRAYFVEFQSVAHLWAAFRVNGTPWAYTPEPREVFHDRKLLTTFLGVAKTIGEFACTYVPKRTRPPKSIVPADELLRIPEEVPALHLKPAERLVQP